MFLEELEDRASNKNPIDRYPQLFTLSTDIAINRLRIEYRTILVLSIVFFVGYDKVAEIGKYLDMSL